MAISVKKNGAGGKEIKLSPSISSNFKTYKGFSGPLALKIKIYKNIQGQKILCCLSSQFVHAALAPGLDSGGYILTKSLIIFNILFSSPSRFFHFSLLFFSFSFSFPFSFPFFSTFSFFFPYFSFFSFFLFFSLFLFFLEFSFLS